MMNYNPLSQQKPTIDWLKVLLFFLGMGFLSVMLIIPLFAIFTEALQGGWGLLRHALTEDNTLSAISLTIIVAIITLPINIFFGLVLAWLLTNYEFKGKQLLLTFVDLPLSISPVIAGLMFVILFGEHGFFGDWLNFFNIQIIFALPGIILATLFVTFPLILRAILPTLQTLGNNEEQAALILGASGWTIFCRITLPKIKWPLFYGAMLANARAMGEFGAVSVVSGHIRGLTNTIPLHVEILYNEYDFVGAFASAAILTLIALLTLLLQNAVLYWQRNKKQPN